MNLKQMLCFKHDYRIMDSKFGLITANYKCIKCGAEKKLVLEDKLRKRSKFRARENFKTFTPLHLIR